MQKSAPNIQKVSQNNFQYKESQANFHSKNDQKGSTSTQEASKDAQPRLRIQNGQKAASSSQEGLQNYFEPTLSNNKQDLKYFSENQAEPPGRFVEPTKLGIFLII